MFHAQICDELLATGKFSEMNKQVDEDEHSLEMHLPYIMKMMKGSRFTLVPIMVGALSASAEKSFGQLLAPYFEDPRNFFVISSDFCHWGSRFRYTYYEKDHGPIYKSIEVLDRRGMGLIEKRDAQGFHRYLQQFENTICGRHPISVFLHLVQATTRETEIEFVRYEQSTQVTTRGESSVSYASALVMA